MTVIPGLTDLLIHSHPSLLFPPSLKKPFTQHPQKRRIPFGLFFRTSCVQYINNFQLSISWMFFRRDVFHSPALFTSIKSLRSSFNISNSGNKIFHSKKEFFYQNLGVAIRTHGRSMGFYSETYFTRFFTFCEMLCFESRLLMTTVN